MFRFESICLHYLSTHLFVFTSSSSWQYSLPPALTAARLSGSDGAIVMLLEASSVCSVSCSGHYNQQQVVYHLFSSRILFYTKLLSYFKVIDYNSWTSSPEIWAWNNQMLEQDMLYGMKQPVQTISLCSPSWHFKIKLSSVIELLFLLCFAGDLCEVSTCSNGGTCVTGPGDKLICICPDGFSGETCNETETGEWCLWDECLPGLSDTWGYVHCTISLCV